MIDLDLTAYVDPVTGIPQVDRRSTAERWLKSLNYGAEQHGTTHLHLATTPIFGPVGAGTNPKKHWVFPTNTQTKTLNNKINMNTNHDHGLLKASELKIENIERLLLEYGFDARIECDWVTVKMSRWSLFFNLVEDVPAVDLAGAFELRQGVSLRKTLRFLNYLNNVDRVVKFSLWEPPCHSGIDPSDLWGSLALPTRSGFSTRQFVAALDLLCSGLEHAFAAAVEVGMADPVECPSNQEALSHGL